MVYMSIFCSWHFLAVEESNVDENISSAAVSFQGLSLHNKEFAATVSPEDNPAVIISDHMQVTNTECARLSSGNSEPATFSALLPPKRTDNNVELPVVEESAPVDQINARDQDYYDIDTVNSSADQMRTLRPYWN